MPEYIEREAAIRALCEAVHDKDGDVPCRNQIVSCQHSGTRTQEYAEKILAIPAADVVPVVRGKWIPVTNGRGGSECNQCHAYAPSHQCGVEYKSNYCPNCGALMDKDGDGE